MQRKETLTEEITKLQAQRSDLNKLLEKDAAKKERRKKAVMKQVEEDSKKKAEAQMLKVKEMMEEGSADEGKMQKVLQEFEAHAQSELKNMKGIKLKESQQFSVVQAADDKLEAQRKLV